jgi:hypothetical protein
MWDPGGSKVCTVLTKCLKLYRFVPFRHFFCQKLSKRHWEKGGSQVGVRWESGGSQVGVRWEPGGSKVGARWE